MLLALRVIMPLGLVLHIPYWFQHLFYGFDFDGDWFLFMIGLGTANEYIDLFSWWQFYSIMNGLVLAAFIAGTVLAFLIKPASEQKVYASESSPLTPPGITN